MSDVPIVPNPGSNDAIKAGCVCPRIDNEYGCGYMGMRDVFVYVENCPLHCPKKEEK